MNQRISLGATASTGDTILFDHINGVAHMGDYTFPLPDPDPPGPLCRAQHWLWKRKRGGWLGNRLSDIRYGLWRLVR